MATQSQRQDVCRTNISCIIYNKTYKYICTFPVWDSTGFRNLQNVTYAAIFQSAKIIWLSYKWKILFQGNAMAEIRFHKHQKKSIVNTPNVCTILRINAIVSPWCNGVICTQGLVYSMSTKKVLFLPSAEYCTEHVGTLHMATTAIYAARTESVALAFQERLTSRDPWYFIRTFQ